MVVTPQDTPTGAHGGGLRVSKNTEHERSVRGRSRARGSAKLLNTGAVSGAGRGRAGAAQCARPPPPGGADVVQSVSFPLLRRGERERERGRGRTVVPTRARPRAVRACLARGVPCPPERRALNAHASCTSHGLLGRRCVVAATWKASGLQWRIQQENAVLSVGSEFLPPLAQRVRDGGELSDSEQAEYFDWLDSQCEGEP